MDSYKRGGHSKYSLKVHIIFVTKYRKKLFFKQYWKHQILWSDGYFACSISQGSQEIIEKYIQNQG